MSVPAYELCLLREAVIDGEEIELRFDVNRIQSRVPGPLNVRTPCAANDGYRLRPRFD
jgi:hypothetical protein